MFNLEMRKYFFFISGISGEMMKQSCASFIKNCSVAKVLVSNECIDSWQIVIDKCLINKSAQIRDAAISALTHLCESYYNIPAREEKNIAIIEFYLKGCENNLEEHVRMGYLSAVGGLPKFMIEHKFDQTLSILIRQSLVPRFGASGSNENTIILNWSEARRDSVKALTRFIQTIGFDEISLISIAHSNYLDRVFDCLLKALEEYTKDNRGDIGAWVREASMNALYSILTTCPHQYLKPDIVHSIMLGFIQQAVEKIDRTRGLAGKLFSNLINQ